MIHLKLHTKTTLLVSVITIAVLGAMMFVITKRVTELVRAEQRELAKLQAHSLAEHISTSPEQLDVEALQRSAQLVHGTRKLIVSVRLWELTGNQFAVRISSSDLLPSENMAETIRAALLGKKAVTASAEISGEEDAVYYRAFAPYFKKGHVAGAVEVVQRLNNIPDLARLYSQSATLMAVLAVILLTAATYLLFHQLIYRPMKRLLYAMARAKAGSLNVHVEMNGRDEFGRLALGFNRMIDRIREMTEEREKQQEVLRERVQEATSELKQRNEQLAEANLQLWDVTSRLGEMERLAAAGQTAAQFAHEVGTPLNLISCHVELLRDEMLASPQSAEARTEIIAEQIERIERIVRQMLDRTQLEKSELAPLDLNLLLRRIGDATEPKLNSRHVRLKLSLAEKLPPIAGEPDHLQQIFINLINNALDAMPDGGELVISTQIGQIGQIGQPGQHDKQIIVEIADNGCGMSEEVRARIFDPLYTTKEHGRGTGLGLVIVNQLMREHDGQIEVESTPGSGAKFRLRFPVIGVAQKTTELKMEAAR